MSLVNLPESFLYERLPAGLIELDERALIQAVVSGYQDRLEDLRAYGKKFQLFFAPVGLPETGPNVVFVDITTSQGRVVTRSLDITTDTPTDSGQLLAWAADQLGLETSSLANARLGLDLLRLVDANILDYLASNIGAVLYKSPVAEQQATSVSSTGTFTATQLAHQKLIETFFPRLKFKGTARSFEALGKLLGFDDVRMVPLWGRVSPRLPNDPGAAVNDGDFSEVPEYFPQQTLNPFYDPHDQRDGVYYHWSGTVANGTAASNYYPQVVNGFQPWVKFEADLTSIQLGTVAHAASGTYLLDGGAAHYKARVAIPATGTFTALGEGESWNGVEIAVTEVGGTVRRLDISDRLSAIKYRTSFYNLGITMDADKADALFGTLAVRPNADLVEAPHAYVSYSGTLFGTSPYRPFTGGTAAFDPTNGVYNNDFLSPFSGTVSYYRERVEASLSDAQQNYTELANAGQSVTQALEEVRAATRMPRTASFGYLQDDTVQYAPIQAFEQVGTAAVGETWALAGTFTFDPVPPYRTGVSMVSNGQIYEADDRLDNRWPERIFHEAVGAGGTVTGFTVPSAGSYSLQVDNSDGTYFTAVYANFYGTVSPIYTGYSDGTAVQGAYPNTHEVVRTDAFTGTQVFAAIADYGLAANMVVGGPAWRVANRVHTWNPEIIITLGDNNYYNGAASTIAANNLMYQPDILAGKIFPSLGNHDLNTDKDGTIQANYFFNGTVPGNAGGRYYSVKRGLVEFFCLNPGWSSAEVGGATGDAYYATTLEPDGNTYDSIQGEWLRNALAKSTAKWKIVYHHYPPYASETTSNSYAPGYPRMRWPYKEWGATIVMTGHVHAYERLEVDGFPYIINGIGGENNRVYGAGYVSPGSLVRYAASPGPTNYGATKIIATESFIRFETWNANPSLPMVDSLQIDAPDRRYMERPEDELDDSLVYETVDEYPYRRDILGGGELVETDFYTTGTLAEEYSILEQTMAVKDQTEVDHDVYVSVGAFSVPQFKVRVRPQPYQPGQRSIAFKGQFRNQATLGPEDLDLYPNTGGRTRYFHADLDNVFQPGYQLFHAGIVNTVLVADPDKFNGPHHLNGLVGWLPFNEHPEAALTVADATLSLAQQSVRGIAPQDRQWDSEQGFSLRLLPGAQVVSSAPRGCEDDLTLSFWARSDFPSGVTDADTVLAFGNVRFQITWSLPPTLTAQVYRADTGWHTVGFGLGLSQDAWNFVYLRKQGNTAYFGYGDLANALSEIAFDASLLGTTLLSNAGGAVLTVDGGRQGFWQIRDLRLWSACKTPAELELVKYHAPTPTVVPYRIGHVLSLNTGDRYGLTVLPNGWLTPSNMPAWVRSPKFAKVVRYDAEGAYQGEPYRKEVGLGGGTYLPTPWKLGEQLYSMTANGTVAISPKLGAMPGHNVLWGADTGPGEYIVLNGSLSTGTLAAITAAVDGSGTWPNQMDACNAVRESIWLENGNHLYEAKLQSEGAGVRFVASTSAPGFQSQGDAATLLATSGTSLTVTSYGSVVQASYSGTVTTPRLYMYLHETLLEDVGGATTLARWTDPSAFGLGLGVPALKEAGELSFTNSSALPAGTYKLTLDLGNVGKPDDEFDGFRLDITFADKTTSHTLLQGYSGNNFRGQEELTLELDNANSGDWLLTLAWLNSFSDPTRGVTRQLAVYGYQLRRLETSVYQVSIAASGTEPDIARVAVVGQQYGTVPGAWLVGINSFGTVATTTHESVVYPENDTMRSKYPLANLLTGMTDQRREDVLFAGTYCLPDHDHTEPDVLIDVATTVDGVVTDATSGDPLSPVVVRYTDSNSILRYDWTSGSGYYLIEDLAVGAATVNVYVYSGPMYLRYISLDDSVVLASGPNTFNYALTRRTLIEGVVTNSLTGLPLAGATVFLQQAGYDMTMGTDSAGAYISTPGYVYAGASTVTVSKTGYVTQVLNPVIGAGWNTVDVALVPSNVVVTGVVSPVGSASITGLGSYTAGDLVNVTAVPATYAAEVYADIVFVVDESGSMKEEHDWLGKTGSPALPQQLETALLAAGIGTGSAKNRYALAAYGSSSAGHGTSQRGHKHLVAGGDWGTAAQLETAATGLVEVGGTEDGYEAARMVFGSYSFRAAAGKLIVLITDEHRTANASPSMTAADFQNLFTANNAILASVVNIVITDNVPSASVIGRKATAAYAADGAGGFAATTFASVVAGTPPAGGVNANAVVDYVNTTENVGGSEWDLNQLRAGGLTAQSFSAAFVDVVKNDILQSLTYTFDSWVIDGISYYTNPLSFTANADTVVYLYMIP